MHRYAEQRTGKKKKHVWIAVLFAISGLICWCGISQVISNSVASSFENAFGIRQAAAGGFGAVLMNGVKRGLFSNEAGSGSAPCAAAAAECDTPVKAGLTQALGVFIDTIVICSCTAMIMLLVPEKMIAGLEGMELLQTAYKVLALVMLFVGGIAAYHIVWDLGDVGIGLMTIFNIVTLYLMGGEALEELRKYEKNK